ncbi:MAG: hypothetical protein QF380_04090 [Candidatus Marinimicrobia bacterium]|nr:hypothetical protein [Candidatus Neomarinimicrobiota bacterium]
MSCQSDPIVYNPAGGYEYQKKSFQLNKDASKTVQGDLHTGMSPRLYSGILLNGDRVSTLIRLLPEVLDSHEVCSADSISKVNISLFSITQLADEDTIFLIQKDSIQIQLISLNEIWDEDIVLDPTKLSTITNTINTTPTISNSLIEIKNQSIDVQIYDHDSDIIQHWCETQEELGIVVSYIPTDTTYLEFYSSNGSEVGLGPRLSLEYSIEEETSKSHARYLIKDVSWGEQVENINGPYYVDDSLSGYWGTFYAMSLDWDSPIITNPPLAYDSVQNSEIVSAGQNSPLFTIDLELNPEIINDIDSISFSILNAVAFMSESDPKGDNFDTDSTGTENNGQLDWTDDNDNGQWNIGEGEEWFDYGEDNCPDIWETGNADDPCDSTSTLSIFNAIGTEVNEQLDWTDANENKLWDEGEGEEWFDWGSDWCPDSLESGDGFCIANLVPCNCLDYSGEDLGYDPNSDNADPVGDDWHEINNPDSTEGNYKWDPGEPFYDWGLDGLPMSIVGYSDAFEGDSLLHWTDNNSNGAWDPGEGERWFDTGTDGKYNEDEVENYENYTEGNFVFNTGERYFDCGEDNICNDAEGDDETDDYNIDPNGDNWSAINSTGTEVNDQLDWTDANENKLWDEGEGEEWFDWGLDGIQDSLEAFHVSSVIPIERYDNSYIFDLDEEILQPTPDLETDTVSLWISEIRKVDENSLNIEVSVQSNKALKGLQFQLYHTPFTKLDTTLETYTRSIAQIGEDKLFEDFTLLPKSEYDPLMLDTTLQINYANDVAAFLDFDSLNLFLENKEYIFSHQYSNLVFYIDATNTDIHEDGMWVYLTHSSDLGDDGSILGYPTYVPSSSDSVEISMGQILRAYQSGSLGSYNGFKLKANDILYNYSKLSIKNNPRIDVIFSQ